MYTGFIYNDIFSKSLNVFGSRWRVNFNMSDLKDSKDFTLDPANDYLGTPYQFGMDPVWQVIIITMIYEARLLISDLIKK